MKKRVKIPTLKDLRKEARRVYGRGAGNFASVEHESSFLNGSWYRASAFPADDGGSFTQDLDIADPSEPVARQALLAALKALPTAGKKSRRTSPSDEALKQEACRVYGPTARMDVKLERTTIAVWWHAVAFPVRVDHGPRGDMHLDDPDVVAVRCALLAALKALPTWKAP